MNCNICGVNEATIHLTEIINNQMIEIHLCETCAQEKGTDFKTHFNFGDLLANLADFDKAVVVGEPKEGTLRCSECGMAYTEFTKTGRLGCAGCYTSFAKVLVPLIKRVQRASHHVGKKPSKISRDVRTSHDLRLLQDRLRKCVQSEEFEDAAKLRDEIKQIQDAVKKSKKAKNE